MAIQVVPRAPLVFIVPTGGTPVIPIPANPGGGFIQNPTDETDQGLGTSENMYVDPVAPCNAGPGSGNGTTFVLEPGSIWQVIPGQTTPTYVNAVSNGHKFSAVWWNPGVNV